MRETMEGNGENTNKGTTSCVKFETSKKLS